MNIRDQILSELKEAMRARESLKVETLRYCLSQIKYKEIALQKTLDDAGIIDVLSSEVKKRQDAIKLFADSGRNDTVNEEEQKLVVIRSLLPAQMSESEISLLVDQAIAKVGKANMGAIMKEVTPQTKGRADGSLVSQIVKAKLSL